MSNLCLVTGACGFSGSYMVELLLEKGYKVRATDLLNSERAYWKEIVQKVEFIPADLTKKETLKDVVKDVEYVFHPAAIFDYSASWEVLEKVNVFGTKNLLEAILENNSPVKRFVNWSTAGVYGLPNPEILPVKEDAPTNPVDLYSKSKLKQEEVVMEFHRKYNIPVTIIRPSPIYGPRNIYGISQVLLNLAKLPVMMVPKNFNTGMPFVHVKDVCNAALFLALKEEANGQIYNVVDDSNMDSYQFVHFFAEVLNKKVKDLPNVHMSVVRKIVRGVAFLFRILSKIIPLRIIVYFRETALYATTDFRFSNEKLKSLGYQFIYPTVREGMRETIQWYRENKMLKK